MQTALLDQTLWDLCLDASGDLAIASEPYSVAQDVASAIRTFLGEVYYDTTIGIPYFQQILGKFPSAQYLKAQFVAAALTVPQVVSAGCFLSALSGRSLNGQVQFVYTPSDSTLPAGATASGLTSFVGSNQGLIAFYGDNGAFIDFEGS